jgi:methylthioribose-1-phosphate isomerase
MTASIDVPVPTIISQNVLIEDDAVRILDRRVFPFEKSWVTCSNHEEVAKAIEDMVTRAVARVRGGCRMTLAARDADRCRASTSGGS